MMFGGWRSGEGFVRIPLTVPRIPASSTEFLRVRDASTRNSGGHWAYFPPIPGFLNPRESPTPRVDVGEPGIERLLYARTLRGH